MRKKKKHYGSAVQEPPEIEENKHLNDLTCTTMQDIVKSCLNQRFPEIQSHINKVSQSPQNKAKHSQLSRQRSNHTLQGN